MSANGGITKGKSHKEGGIPMVVKSTGQQVELEGGEGVINKRNMASDKKFEFQGKQMTTCEIASEINSANGNGVQIECDDVTGKKYEYSTGGKILNEDEEESFKEWMDDGNVIEQSKGVYSTQDAQYRNRLKGLDELRKYFRKEFLSDSYEGGGGVEDYINIDRMNPRQYEMVTNFNTLKSLAKNGFIELHEKTGLRYTNVESKYMQENRVTNVRHDYIESAKNPKFEFKNRKYAIGYSKGLNFLRIYVLEDMSKSENKYEGGGLVQIGDDVIINGIEYSYLKREKTETRFAPNHYEYTFYPIYAKDKSLKVDFRNDDDFNNWFKINGIKKEKYEGGGGVYHDKTRFPNEGEIVLSKDVDYDMMSFFDRTNKNLLITLKNGKKVKASVGQFYNDIIFNGDFPKEIEGANYKLQLKEFEKIEIVNQMSKGGSVKDYNSLIGKYVNIYSMGVSLPTEHQIKDVQVSGENFRYRYVTLKFDLGIAPISLEEADAFMNNEIIFVNDNKEEFGVQLIPNQFKEGGDVRDFDWYQMWKKDQVKKGTATEMEHIDSIREFKKRGVSDKEVAEAIAKDHLDEDENYYMELEKMDVDAIKRKKKQYREGGNVHSISNIMHPTDSKVKRVLKNDFDINFQPKNIFVPKQSLGLTRIEMPQIRGQFLPLLFDKLDNDRISYEDLRVMPNTLKPSQNEINIDNANRLNMDSVYLKKAIVSNDNFIIDGHHRWYYCLVNNIPIDITKIDLPIEEALNYIRQLDFVQVDTIEKGGMLSDSQKSLFGEGGNIEANKYSKEIPIDIYTGVTSDYDKDGIANADDLEPNKPSETKLEEISLKDELTDIVDYRNLFVQVQKNVLDKIQKINTCGNIQCSIKTRIKTPYSIINKLRRRSLTDVKTLDKLDKKAKEFLKNKNLKGIDLYKGLTDILGFMVIVEDFESLTKLKNEIEKGNLGEVLEFDDFYKNDNNGYRAYHFLLSTEANGTFIPYELQIRTRRVNELALITHTIYKQGKMNGAYNDKIAKQIELADKGNKTIARLVDKELVDKELINRLTIQKFAMGDVVMDEWMYEYNYKVKNNSNKQIYTITEFAENESQARKSINKKYKNITILSVSVNDKEYVAIDEFEDKQTDKNRVDIFETFERFEYADEFKKGGVVYKDLSTIKPDMVNDASNTFTTEVDEVTINKTGKTFLFHERKITGSSGAYQLLKDFWNVENIDVVEEMNIIYLDTQNKPISIYRHSKGGIDSTIADIEVISAVAVKTLAKGVIISHNHPSGNLTASNSDLEVSQKLKNALKLFNIILLDSMIVTKNGYYSMADDGVFKMGGNVQSNSHNSTLLLDEADTKNGDKIFLVKLKDVFYVIYEGDIVFQSNNLKEAKEDFELALYYDKTNAKKMFDDGGEVAKVLDIPKLYFQDEKGKNAIVYLHYFSSGSDWFITELDKTTGEAFGYVILNGDTQNSEFGYMDINELSENNDYIELDKYWTPQTLNEIFEKRFPELVDGVVEYYSKDQNLTRLTNYEVVIEKNAFKNQYEVNQLIELMIDEKGTDANMYTTMEQSFLQRYSGMGGLQKYGATGKGILWEYYTPKNIADIMWQLAYKHKSVESFDRVLENSVGVGVFVNSCPSAVRSMDCYDISKYAISICNILYGQDERFSFLNRSFETKFFDGNTSLKGNVTPIYDLVIGNPPYSEYSGKYAGMGEKKYTKAENYIDYFIFRSLDLLKSGGLLVYILGSVKGMGQDNWLESKDNYTKLKIKEKADLVDALRLGSGVFEFTDVDSDIIVLRKK